MNVRTIIKKILKEKNVLLAKKIYHLIKSDPIDFNFSEIENIIYNEFDKTDNINYYYLYQDVTKNGILTNKI